MKLVEPILAYLPELQEIRRDLHAHPELCYEEQRTADVVAAKLTEWGIPIVRGLGVTGVVGSIKNGTSNRAIGLRADMDALPMQEINGFAHASRHPGKMHACGHDGHTAMLLGAAQHLAQHRNFDGTVYLIFQPAEEGGGGARRMMIDGLFEQFPMDAVYGMHNWPGIPEGHFGVVSGPMMASSNEFRVSVRGKGAHAAQPHRGIDPVMVAVQIAQATHDRDAPFRQLRRHHVGGALLFVAQLRMRMQVAPDFLKFRQIGQDWFNEFHLSLRFLSCLHCMP